MAAVIKPVYSSSVQGIGFDPERQELHVAWPSGKVSVYSGVPAALADDVSKAWSVGKAVKEQIVGNFEHRYAGEEA